MSRLPTPGGDKDTWGTILNDYLRVAHNADGTPKQLALAYGTSLPASPVDGQEAILVDSLTNPSYQWRFRYNAGSTSPYKWEFVGGSEAISFVGASESPGGSNIWTNLPTAGPDIQLSRSGDYILSVAAVVNPSVNVGYLGVANWNVGPNSLIPNWQANLGSGMGVGLFTTARANALPVNALLRFVVNVTAAGIVFSNRTIIARPVRVA